MLLLKISMFLIKIKNQNIKTKVIYKTENIIRAKKEKVKNFLYKIRIVGLKRMDKSYRGITG